ncbi:MAG TPA: hypothetical protein VGY66_29580 [Gemmataceae bacterium]|jgi:hypothetical protein|nr:hypothetical protein [Gemmataceae bacterium]
MLEWRRPEEALAAYDRARATWQQLIGGNPESSQYQGELDNPDDCG